MAKGKVAVSLFAGGGGLDCGLEAAGFTVAASVDVDPHAVATLALNGIDAACCDIAELTGRRLQKLAGVRRRGIDLLVAGPPCQPFSKSANWRHGRPRGLQDQRADTTKHLMRLVGETLPRVLLIENVEGFKRGGVARIKRALSAINRREGTNYKLVQKVLDAADYGVPQHRRRLFMVAARNGDAFSFPAPTHGPESPTGRHYICSWDAIGGLALDPLERLDARGRWAALLPSIPEGENYLFHTTRGGGEPLFGWRTRYWNFLLKLAKGRPAWTLSASPAQNAGPFHWANRELSTMEAQRLQSFPTSWQFSGDRDDRIRQIGNAVPPLLAEQLAFAIGTQLCEWPKATSRSCKLSISKSRKKRRVTSPKPVPPVFLELLGDHGDHPGPGKGPGARRRLASKANGARAL